MRIRCLTSWTVSSTWTTGQPSSASRSLSSLTAGLLGMSARTVELLENTFLWIRKATYPLSKHKARHLIRVPVLWNSTISCIGLKPYSRSDGYVISYSNELQLTFAHARFKPLARTQTAVDLSSLSCSRTIRISILEHIPEKSLPHAYTHATRNCNRSELD